MPYDNSEDETPKAKARAKVHPRARRTMNLVVAGAVAATPLVGCGSNKPAAADAALHMDATGSPDMGDASGDGMLAMDSAGKDAGSDSGSDAAQDTTVDLGDDGGTDSYPDGVRG